MADMKKVYDDLIIINLYLTYARFFHPVFFRENVASDYL